MAYDVRTMTNHSGFTALLGLAAAAISCAALGQDAAPLYVVTYFEARPPARAEAAAALKAQRDAARRDEGNLRSEVVQHASRPGQFVMLSAWKDAKAFEAQRDNLRTREFLDRVHALRVSPADNRLHGALSVGALDAGRAAAGAVWVVTHVDVIPPRKDDAVVLLKELGEASRKDDGNLRYEIVQQTNRPNHFTVIEVWKSRQAFEAHGISGHVREFRDKLAPMSGALYDERLYEVLN